MSNKWREREREVLLIGVRKIVATWWKNYLSLFGLDLLSLSLALS